MSNLFEKAPRREPGLGDDRGKWAENEVKEWLKARAAVELRFGWHRYPDTRAARNYIENQPSDFMVARKWRPPSGQGWYRRVWNLEVKETAEKYRLPAGKLSQWAKLRMLHMCGMEAVCLIYRSSHGDWVYLDGDALFNHDEKPTSFPTRNLRSFASHEDALQEIFQ